MAPLLATTPMRPGRRNFGSSSDMFTPTGAKNGLAIVDIASGAWHADRGKIRDHQTAQMYTIFCSKGYTVFAVRPGS